MYMPIKFACFLSQILHSFWTLILQDPHKIGKLSVKNIYIHTLQNRKEKEQKSLFSTHF